MRILLLANGAVDQWQRLLQQSGFQVDIPKSNTAVEQDLLAGPYDLLVCVESSGPCSPSVFFGRLRAKGALIPIMLIWQGADAAVRASALDNGMDDCVSDSIEAIELVARCRALVRRAKRLTGHRHAAGRLSINMLDCEVRKDDLPVALTRREWTVFECLWRNNGRLVPKRLLLESLTREWSDELSDNAVEVYVSRLRSKLADVLAINAVRGVGYRIEVAKARATE